MVYFHFILSSGSAAAVQEVVQKMKVSLVISIQEIFLQQPNQVFFVNLKPRSRQLQGGWHSVLVTSEALKSSMSSSIFFGWGLLRYRSKTCIGKRCQDDIFPRIELFPLSSCQVIILIARMTFNCSASCLMS